MKKISNGWLATIVIALVIIIDQVLKIWVKTHFYYGEDYEITSWFKLQFIENNGMAFGMELGSKVFLTWFRIIAVALFIYYLCKLRVRTDIPKGYIVCISMITAGALGNVIDCIFYGTIFNAPPYPEIAQLFPPEGGYQTLFNGRVVDMLYFPLCEWNWPAWMPVVGGNHFIFFQPIFNIADASLSVSVVVLILFYSKYLASPDKKADDAEVVDDNTTETE
ncbi:MAG: lipoprotein signal peptidase [Muribaculaceae bacterium]|nr:lipoprotein signal peptidase [Muribaculaceae bacterium]